MENNDTLIFVHFIIVMAQILILLSIDDQKLKRYTYYIILGFGLIVIDVVISRWWVLLIDVIAISIAAGRLICLRYAKSK